MLLQLQELFNCLIKEGISQRIIRAGYVRNNIRIFGPIEPNIVSEQLAF